MAWFLLFRLFVVNVTALAGIYAAYLYGWVDDVVTRDTSGISIGIAAIFACGCIYSLQTGWYVGRQFELLNQKVFCFDDIETMETRLGNRLGTIAEVASALVLLGLIGTVLGFIEALINPEVLNVSDPNMAKKVLSNLVNGMGIALYTTLVGSVLNVWLRFNYRMVHNASSKLIAAMKRGL